MTTASERSKRAGRQPDASCDGKRRFDSYALARHVVRYVNRASDTPRQPYRCHCCGGWHLGSLTPGEGRRELREFKRRKEQLRMEYA